VMGALSIKTEEDGTCGRVEEIEHREFVPEIDELGKFCNPLNYGWRVKARVLA